MTRHGPPLRHIVQLADIADHTRDHAAPQIVRRQLAGASRSPAPAPAFMFGGNSPALARMLFGQVDVPASSCFALDDAAVGPSGVIIKDGTAFCGDTIGVPAPLAAAAMHRLNARAVTTSQVAGVLISLFGADAGASARLVTDVMPLLWVAAAAGHDLDRAHVLVPAGAPAEAPGLLLAAGLCQSQLVQCHSADTVVRARRVVVPALLRQGSRFAQSMPEASRFWTSRLRLGFGLPTPLPLRRLFLSPRDSPDPNGVAHWQVIEAAAEAQAMTVIHASTLTLAVRADLFGEAACLMGFEGAELMQACLLAGPGTPVCAVLGNLANGAQLAGLTHAMDQPLGFVVGQCDPEDASAPATVHACDLQNAFDSLSLLNASKP